MIIPKTPEQVALLRQAGHLAALSLRTVGEMVRPGVSTRALNKAAERFIVSSGAKPAFKGYRGFPGTICVSVNQEVVHGIPSGRKLKEGDVLGVDVGVLLNGFYGDCAATFPVGRISAETQRLLATTQRALWAGIRGARVGHHLSDVSHAIQEVAEAEGFSVVREFVGHGIGQAMHEDPQIPNFGPPGHGPVLEEGMVMALEPMVNEGAAAVKILADGWTVVTADGGRSAHFEHMIAVTNDGPDVLTVLAADEG